MLMTIHGLNVGRLGKVYRTNLSLSALGPKLLKY